MLLVSTLPSLVQSPQSGTMFELKTLHVASHDSGSPTRVKEEFESWKQVCGDEYKPEIFQIL